MEARARADLDGVRKTGRRTDVINSTQRSMEKIAEKWPVTVFGLCS